MSETQIRAQSDPWTGSVEILILERLGDVTSVAKNITLEAVEEGGEIEPTMRIAPSQVQVLFNDLWNMGYRPADGTGNSGHVAALETHIQDFRNILEYFTKRQK